MIEARPQKAVAGGVDPGKPEACHISAAAVTVHGYNGSAASQQGQLRQSDD